MVRARLTEDDDTVAPKLQWPPPAQCHACFYNETLADWGLGSVNPSQQPAEYAVRAADAEAKHLVKHTRVDEKIRKKRGGTPLV